MKIIKNNIHLMEFVATCQCCKSVLMVNYSTDVFKTMRKYEPSKEKFYFECPLCNRRNEVDPDTIPPIIKEKAKQLIY